MESGRSFRLKVEDRTKLSGREPTKLQGTVHFDQRLLNLESETHDTCTNKIPGHYYVDLLGATFSIIPM